MLQPSCSVWQLTEVLPDNSTEENTEKIKVNKKSLFAVFLCAACGVAGAQVANPTTTLQWPQSGHQHMYTPENGEVPLYRITVVGRTIPAINYIHRSGATEIGFRGTNLLPQGRGSAKVESLKGRMMIDAKFKGLVPANSFGIEYLTYVLWAITPDGRPVNLGEVLPDGTKCEITVTTNLQAYGLIVTAEPYYAVTMPSDLVVMENYVLPNKTQGVIQQVDAHYELLPRGIYGKTGGQHTVQHPITRDDVWPLSLYEAINAVQIADAEGAEKYAAAPMARAKQYLRDAKQMDGHKSERKMEISYARQAVQAAEDARIMTVRKMRDDRAREEKAKTNG